jgi:spore maturation protein CgeB
MLRIRTVTVGLTVGEYGVSDTMRIFYASGKRPNGALADSTIWHENLFGALVDLGHDVVEFVYDLEPLLAAADFTVPENAAFIEQERPSAVEALIRQLGDAHRARPVDLLFSYFYASCTSPEAIGEIRRMGVKTMNWYCNGSYQLDLVAEIAPAYDWCLVPERFRLDDYRALGANPIYCQEAANPHLYRPYDLPREYDVTFVGARYADRPSYIKRLLDAGIDAHAWGPGWADSQNTELVENPGDFFSVVRNRRLWRPAASRLYRRAVGYPGGSEPPVRLPKLAVGAPLSDLDMVKTYSRSKISLGFSTVAGVLEDGERITQVRLRDFEAPMSGAFYMVERLDEISEFFEVGREIVCYDGPDDLLDRCKYYLTHETEREAIRVAGHERAMRDHTWQRRLSDTFTEAGLL